MVAFAKLHVSAHRLLSNTLRAAALLCDALVLHDFPNSLFYRTASRSCWMDAVRSYVFRRVAFEDRANIEKITLWARERFAALCSTRKTLMTQKFGAAH